MLGIERNGAGKCLTAIDGVIKQLNTTNRAALGHLHRALLPYADPDQPGCMLAGVHAIVIADKSLTNFLREAKQEGLLPSSGVGRISVRYVPTGPLSTTLLPMLEFILAGAESLPGKFRIDRCCGCPILLLTAKDDRIRPRAQHDFAVKGPGYPGGESLAPLLPGFESRDSSLLSRNGVGIHQWLSIAAAVSEAFDAMLKNQLPSLGSKRISLCNTAQLARADFMTDQLLHFVQDRQAASPKYD
jgi:hypothetical protein